MIKALKFKMYLAFIGARVLTTSGFIFFMNTPDLPLGGNLIKLGLISDAIFVVYFLLYLRRSNKKAHYQL